MSLPPSQSDWVEPLEPLGYVNPQHLNPRPTILTAVGVLSIVVAGISFLASAGGAMMALGFVIASGITMPPMPVMSTTSSTSGVKVSGTLIVADDEGLDADTIEKAVAVLTSRRNLDAARQAHLKALLEHAGLQVFPTPDGHMPTEKEIEDAITSDGVASGGNRSVYFVAQSGRIEVSDDAATFRPKRSAEYVRVSARNGGKAATVPANPTTAPAPPATMPNPLSGINRRAAAIVLGENVVSALLAVYLLIAGIMTLRDARIAGRLHWVYVGIKLPLIVVAAVASLWMWSGFMRGIMSGMPPGTAVPAMRNAMATPMVMMALLAAAYPVGLIFVLLSRNVRKFYGVVMTPQ